MLKPFNVLFGKWFNGVKAKFLNEGSESAANASSEGNFDAVKKGSGIELTSETNRAHNKLGKGQLAAMVQGEGPKKHVGPKPS